MPAEIGQLYGRAGAVELTKEFLSRPGTDGAARTRRQPIVVFTGPHGSGKTALLDKLEEWLQPLAPYARIDCAADDLSSSPRVLSALVFELNRTAGRYGRVAFPRFIIGQLVLRQELVTDDRQRACGQVRQALAEYRNIGALRDFLVEIGEDTWTVLHHGQAPPVSRTGVRYLAKLVLNGLIASRLGRRVLLGKGLDWYGHQGRGLHRDRWTCWSTSTPRGTTWRPGTTHARCPPCCGRRSWPTCGTTSRRAGTPPTGRSTA